jgi:hypothetical protein
MKVWGILRDFAQRVFDVGYLTILTFSDILDALYFKLQDVQSTKRNIRDEHTMRKPLVQQMYAEWLAKRGQSVDDDVLPIIHSMRKFVFLDQMKDEIKKIGKISDEEFEFELGMW